jgi:hypothetical protein
VSPYDLPNWLLGLLIVGATTSSAIGAFVLYKRRVADPPRESHLGVAMVVLPIVATVHSLLLAFAAVSVWEAYSNAESAVVEEADVVGQLARDLAVFGSPESVRARGLLRDYTKSVVEVEWPELREGKSVEGTWEMLDDMFRAVGQMEPDTPRREALLPEILSKTNELVKLRRDRIYSSGSHIPGILWTVALVGAMLTLGIAFVWPADRFHVAMIGALAFSVGLVFFLLVALDKPFAGQEGIAPAPFESALFNMERWDRSGGEAR